MQTARRSVTRAESKRWAVAAACVGGALGLRYALSPWLDAGQAPLLAFAAAAMLAGWVGGFAPGLAAALAGAILADALFLAPLGIRSVPEAVSLTAYLATAIIGVIACASIARGRRLVRALTSDLEAQRRTLHDELHQRRRAEVALREMEKRSRRVLESNVVALVLADFQGNLLDANDAFLDLVGYTRADLDAGRLNLRELTPPELHHLDVRAAEAVRIHGRHDPFEKQFRRADGTRVPVLMGTALMPGMPDVGIGYIVDLSAQKRAEQVLQDGERRLRLLTDAMPALVCFVDHHLVYRFANRAYADWFGLAPEQVVGRPVPEVTGEAAYEIIVPYLRRALGGERLEYQAALPYKDGPPRVVHAHYVPHVGQDGAVHGIYIMVQDITARHHAEEALKQGEHRFAAFMNNIPGAAWMKDLRGRYVYANAEAQRIFNTPLDDLLGKTDGEIFDRETAEQFCANDQVVLDGDGSVTTVEKLQHPDGVEHHSLVSKFAVPGTDGRAAYVGGVAIDITSRLAAEHALRDSERRYRFLAESIPQIVFTARPDGVVNYHNDRLFEYLGATREQLRTLGWIHFRHPDDRAEATRRWNHSIATAEPYECMYRMLRGSDQAWRWHLARAVPMRDESGQTVMWFGTCTDVDDQRRAQDALGESEQEFRAVFELAGSGKAMVDSASGRFVRVNRKLCEMLGYAHEELLERSFSDVTHPDDREWTRREAARMMRDETPIYSAEKRYLRKDGRVIWVHVTATMIRDAHGRGVRAAGVIQDITERKRAEQALRDSEASLARAQRIAGVGSWEIAWASRRVEWSEQMYRIFGVSRDEFSPSIDGMFSFIPEGERAGLRDAFERALRERAGFHVDHRIAVRDGSVRHVNTQAEVIFDRDGRPLKLAGTTLDITERKHYEEELSAANQAKDQFLAMLSHELRTPLTPVVLAIDSLHRDAALPARVRDDLDMIRRNVGLEAKLIDDLLDLTRVARGKLELHRETIDVHAALAHAVRSCCGGADGVDKQLTIRLDLAAQHPHVRADAARLGQVFFNLLRNAVKFTPAGGTIAVRTRDDAGDDRRLRIDVCDSGVGIDPHVLPRLFNAFEQGDRTVTRNFGGLGLGLAICKAIIDLHGGAIRAHSDGANRGATFTIELPTCEPGPAGDERSPQNPSAARPAASAGADLAATAATARPRLLLVEDHLPTATMMLRLFQHLGYSVKSAADLASARQLAEGHEFDLVISDLGLPDGSGLDLMRDLRARHGLRGIALSGFGMEEDLLQSKAAGFLEHLVKPISFDKLEAAIHRVLRDAGDDSPQRALAET